MKILFAALLLSGCGASGPSLRVETRSIPRSSPAPAKVAPSVLRDVAPGRVLVLSPQSMGQVSGLLTAETSAAPGAATATATGVLQSSDYNVAMSAVEAALLEGGWRPISQAVLAKAAADAQVQQSLRELRRTGQQSLLEQAMILGKAVQADHVLILRALTTGVGSTLVGAFRPSKACTWRGIAPFTLESDLALLNKDGEVIWTGRTKSQATDLLPVAQATLTYSYDRGTNLCETDWGEKIPGEVLGSFCMAWWPGVYGDAKGTCESLAPGAEAVKLLIEANIPRAITALNQAARGR
jgi:hypothetical protein